MLRPYDYDSEIPRRDGSSPSQGAEEESPRPIKELVSEFLEQGRRLVRAEVQLARAEVRDELKKTTAGVSMTAAGGVVVLLEAFTFVAFLVIALAGESGRSTPRRRSCKRRWM